MSSDVYATVRDQMVGNQVRTVAVFREGVLAAMHAVQREQFVPPELRPLAYADCALPLPHGKRMLPPQLVGRILQALDPLPGMRALEVGTGSGYLSACLASLGAGVRSLELYPDIAAAAREHLQAARLAGKVEVLEADGMQLDASGVYDLVVLTAALAEEQPRFQRALKVGGRMFVVVGTPPVMEARLVRRTGEQQFLGKTLFETCIEPLEHVPAPAPFRF